MRGTSGGTKRAGKRLIGQEYCEPKETQCRCEGNGVEHKNLFFNKV